MDITKTAEREMLSHVLDILENLYPRLNERSKDETIGHVIRKLATIVKHLEKSIRGRETH